MNHSKFIHTTSLCDHDDSDGEDNTNYNSNPLTNNNYKTEPT